MGVSEKVLTKKCSCGGYMLLTSMSNNNQLLSEASNKVDSLYVCELCPLVESYYKTSINTNFVKIKTKEN